MEGKDDMVSPATTRIEQEPANTIDVAPNGSGQTTFRAVSGLPVFRARAS